ncbi:MAG TPA: murein biosynthesis integral membrane protein MurJ [Candidatus Limnocylindrales bacterium]|nr:murein biosynthesis integral membrane protein MurJ [Candidatus Limnocylindrales bacterium]
MTEKRQILKSASVITLITLVSRICGYVRDQRITLLLGTSVAADSFILAFRIPNLLRRLVGEGSLSASFIPVFARYLKNEDERTIWRFANRIFWTVALFAGVLAILGILFSKWIIYAFTIAGPSHARWGFAVYLNRMIFPYIFFVALAAVAMGILNSYHVFGVSASAPIFFNLSLIVFSIAAIYKPIMRLAPIAYRNPAVALAAGVLVGGALQFLVQVPALVRRGMRFDFGINFRDPGVKQVGKLLVPGFVGIGIYQINFFVDTIFSTASRMPRGSITSLYVAERVMELVLGSYAIAMSTVILPMMSRLAAAAKHDEMKKTFTFSLRLVSFITIPAAVGLVLLRTPIIQVLFQHGKFVAESTALAARALFYYALGLPAFAAVKIVVPLFYSTQDTKTPVTVAGYALAINVILNVVFLLLFFRVFYNGSPALATSIAAYFNFFTLLWIFRKRFGRLGFGGVLISLGKIAAAAVVMGLGCVAFLRFVNFDSHAHILPRIGLLSAVILGGAGLYVGLAWLLRCEELGELQSVLRRADRAGA